MMCHVMSATARPDSGMDQFVDALGGRDGRRESRIARTRRDFVGDDAPAGPNQVRDAAEAAGGVRLMDPEPTHVCQVEWARWAEIGGRDGVEPGLDELDGRAASLIEDRASQGFSHIVSHS
jgi:hypothetical protein